MVHVSHFDVSVQSLSVVNGDEVEMHISSFANLLKKPNLSYIRFYSM